MALGLLVLDQGAPSHKNPVSIIAAILAFLRMLPASIGLVEKLADALNSHAAKVNEADAQKLRTNKDAAVDAWVDAPVGVPVSRPTGQLGAVDGSTGRAGSPAGSAGVVQGRVEDNQFPRTGAGA